MDGKPIKEESKKKKKRFTKFVAISEDELLEHEKSWINNGKHDNEIKKQIIGVDWEKIDEFENWNLIKIII